MSCIPLCIIAPAMLMPISENGHRFNFNSSAVTAEEHIPPAKLSKNAVAPRVQSAKSDFITEIYIPPAKEENIQASTVIMLESPGFAPGGKNGSENADSIAEMPIAAAPRMPQSAIFADLFFIR